jgi:hypothetical protein
MQPADANALGYANTALITALFDVLADKGILTVSELEMVATNAIDGLQPDSNIKSVNGAIAFIKAAVIPQIRKNGAA